MARISDVIQLTGERPNELVRRFPERGMGDFRIGSQLIVREAQVAVFFRDGKALDTFEPGRHTLTTANLPLLTGFLSNLVFNEKTIFAAEVFFVNTRDFPNERWGVGPVPLETPGQGWGWLLVGMNGTFHCQVNEPQRFVTQFVGNRGSFSTNDIRSAMLADIEGALIDVLGTTTPGSITKLMSLRDEFGVAVKAKVNEEFAELGILLKDITIGQVNALDSSEEKLRKMGLIDAAKYAQLQAADAMLAAAQQEGGGMAGLGAGAGAGLAIGQQMAQALGQTMQPSATQEAAPNAVPDVMNPAQAAAYLQVSEADIIQMIESGELKAKKIGSQYRISKSVIDEFLAG
ncbi:MAG: SPFH domain-containing protein [Anaerolineae bacterium]|nr:MAG: SPFH domain-containing protein [Anaerolineae bacterium]